MGNTPDAKHPNQSGITPTGREMVVLPLHPRLAHMLVMGGRMGPAALACDVAALLSERDPLRSLEGEERCDFSLRLEALRAYRHDGKPGARRFGADPVSCAAAERAARQWRRLMKVQADDAPVDETLVGRLLALAYPDRIARRRGSGERRYRLSNGRGARLSSECAAPSEMLVAASIDGRGEESRIFLAAPVTLTDLEAVMSERMVWQPVVGWERMTETVVAREERRLGELVLSTRPLTEAEPEQQVAAMVEGVREMGLSCLPWTDEARRLQARVCALSKWQPQAGWPNLSEQHLLETLEEWLAPYLTGITRRDHLSRLKLGTLLTHLLGWEMQQRLETAAPESMRVPSGSRKRLDYAADGSPPVLAVKLQELFGLADTPTVADGKVAVMLHLLSPAQRPLQVTQDLKSFWNNTYPEVKKEMKGRYPKHPWPDDPWNALPTAYTKRRDKEWN